MIPKKKKNCSKSNKIIKGTGLTSKCYFVDISEAVVSEFKFCMLPIPKLTCNLLL